MKFLVLHDGVDSVARAVAELLTARNGGDAAISLTMTELQRAIRWSHEQACGKVRNTLVLGNGRVIDLGRVVVFNRLPIASTFQFARASREDQQYAFAEMQAFMLSWLASLPGPVVNACDHFGMAGPQFDSFSWITLANRAGIPTRDFSLTSSIRRYPRADLLPIDGCTLGRSHATLSEPLSGQRESLVAIGGKVFGQPVSLRPAVARLARLADADVLEVNLSRIEGKPGRWVFESANAVPRTLSSDATLALAYLLESKWGEIS